MTRIGVHHMASKPDDCTCSWVGLDIWAVDVSCPSDHGGVEYKVESV